MTEQDDPNNAKHLFTSPEAYRRAISDLEASTLAIESHISTHQKVLAQTSPSSTAFNAKSQSNATQPQSQSQTQRQHKQLSSQITTLQYDITQFLQRTSSSLAKAIGAAIITVDDTLSRHDYTFTQLERSLSALSPSTGAATATDDGIDLDSPVTTATPSIFRSNTNGTNDDLDNQRVERMLAALIRTECEVIRCRLDRIYLETLTSSTSTFTSTSTSTNASTATNGHGQPARNPNTARGISASSRINHQDRSQHNHRDDTSFNEDAPKPHGDQEDGNDTEIDTGIRTLTLHQIRSDLRSLSGEIDDLSSMLVAHEHGDALQKLQVQIARSRQSVSSCERELAVQKIREMTGQLRGVIGGMIGLQGERVVVQRLAGELDGMALSAGGGGGVGIGVKGAGVGSVTGAMQDTGGSRRVGIDGPAVIALRSYLGVSGGGQSRRIGEAFEDVKGEIEGALESQERQAGILKGKSESVEDDTKGTGEGDDGSGHEYSHLFEELDEEIAGLKAMIDGLNST